MKKRILIALVVVLALAATASLVYANNSIDTSGPPSHWGVVTLYADGIAYGDIWMRGWYTTESYDPGLDGTINHVIWEVVDSGNLPPRIAAGDNVFSIHGWYEDGSIKWIHNAKDFNMHLETHWGVTCPTLYGGWGCRAVSGKSYGTSVTGTIEWHWAWMGSPPFTP